MPFLGSLKLRILSLHPRCPCPRIRCWPSDLEPLGVWPASSCSHKKSPGGDRGKSKRGLGEKVLTLSDSPVGPWSSLDVRQQANLSRRRCGQAPIGAAICSDVIGSSPPAILGLAFLRAELRRRAR